MAKKPFIGSVIIHPTGTNPYDRKVEHPYRIGDERAEVLKQFRATGTLPDGFSLWNDDEREPITSPDQIDWSHMRD